MHTLSALAIRDRFKNGELSAVEIAKHFLGRIESIDPKVNAFLSTLSDRALKQAEALDLKRSKGEETGKLAAVPIAIKDNIHIKGELSTCASRFLSNFKAPFDATTTRLLEAEGAIFIGKTNMDEFAMGSSTENSAFKTTRNPWDLDCIPGGSSGGSAAAVAARMAPIALGSDTGGSIRQPASLCGVVGFKPTYGRVSRFGLVAFGSSLDQIGPLTATSADAALIMETLGQHCDRDSTSLNSPAEEYLSTFDGSLSDAKIGVPWQFLEKLDPKARAVFDTSIDTLRSLGAEIVDIDLSILEHSIATYYILATAEASTNLARFDGVRYGLRSKKAQTLDEVYDLSKEEGFGHEVKRRILLGTYVLSAGYQDAYYRKGQKIRTLMIQRFREAFATCDLIAMPVAPHAAFTIGSVKDPLQMYLEDIYTIGANLAGIPAASVPAGFIDGKPYGLQLLGRQKGDVGVLKAADAFERATNLNPIMPDIAL